LFCEQSVASKGNTLLVGVFRFGESREIILAIESVKNLSNWTTCALSVPYQRRDISVFFVIDLLALLAPDGDPTVVFISNAHCLVIQ